MAATGASELALRVEEHGKDRFFWVLVEPFDDYVSEALHYRPFMTAPAPQPAYWSALVLGMAELRRRAAAEPAPCC